ncbi:hypothetical protein G5B39_16660 (plasmid) [Rhodobacteraceae bacterium SC52]|nr:hypothetical protein G5B39_16660 [Rhodobacteraceae bacterium SC52]
MLVIFLKFLEVGTRAIFVVLTSYSLEIEQAGQFGLIVTLQGLASFAFGYERHIDLIRRMVGKPDGQFDRAVFQAIHLYGVNYIVGVPLFAVLLILIAHLSPALIGLCVVIAIAEQLMNAAYHLAMVEKRYRKILFVTAVKNIVIAAAVIVGAVRTDLDLPYVLAFWAAASAIGLGVIVVFWITLRQHAPDTEKLGEALVRQYRASSTHFLLGMTAVFTIQIDRLLVGAFLPLADVGIYFRHLVLISMLYQVFNIAFHNRILPKVFAEGRKGDVAPLVRIVRREYLNVLAFWAMAAVAGVLLHLLTNGFFAVRYHLQVSYFIGLLAMSAIRTRADLNALVFNALHQERTVFRLQLVSFALSLPVMIVLAHVYGIAGFIIAGGVSASLYLALTTMHLSRITSVKIHDQ